jgi:hypothetical protein
MAADVTSLVRNGPSGVNFGVRVPSCGFVMTAIVNLPRASALFSQALRASLHGRLAGLPGRIRAPIPAQVRLARGGVQTQLRRDKCNIRLSSLGGNRYGYRNCSYGTTRQCEGSLRQHCWKPVDPAYMRHNRDDRHLQLSICLYALYARHETDIYGSTLRENSGSVLGFYSV